MTTRSVEDKLREEYFLLLPTIKKINEQLEVEVRYYLLPLLNSLQQHERYIVESRIKECESAINSLRRRQEASTFIQNQPEEYSLNQLKDLAGVRILVFPHSLAKKVEEIFKTQFSPWISDPIPGFDESAEPQALKYYGLCHSEKDIYGEIQIVPMLTGLFWEVEHDTIYKPKPELKRIADSLEMKEKTQQVLNALRDFEDTFESLLNQNEI